MRVRWAAVRLVPSSFLGTGLGPATPATLFAFGAGLTTWLHAVVSVLNMYHVNARHVWLNLWLWVALGLSVTPWTLAVCRQRLSPATGGGLVIAVYALLARSLCEFMVAWVGMPLRGASAGEPALTLCAALRYGGLAAFAFGLASAAAAQIAEIRLRRRAPSWVIPP